MLDGAYFVGLVWEHLPPAHLKRCPMNQANQVLDLRDRRPAYPPPPVVANPGASGTVNGWTLEAQQRLHNGTNNICIRITAPTGETLDIIASTRMSGSSVRGIVTATLSADITHILGKTKPAKTSLAVERLQRVLAASRQCLATGITGHEAAFRIKAAATDTDFAVYAPWIGHLNDRPGERVTHAEIYQLINHGFTPDTVRPWLTCRYAGEVINPADFEIRTAAIFRDHGWTPTDAAAFQAQARLRPKSNYEQTLIPWVTLGHDRAALAHAAGLDATEAHRLIDDGTWNETSLRVLAGLTA